MNGLEKKKPVATNNRLQWMLKANPILCDLIIASFHIKRKENQ